MSVVEYSLIGMLRCWIQVERMSFVRMKRLVVCKTVSVVRMSSDVMGGCCHLHE